MEGPQVNFARKYDPRVPSATRRVASPDLATRFVLQKCQKSHVPNYDDTQSLRVALQRQNYSIHGEVSKNQPLLSTYASVA